MFKIICKHHTTMEYPLPMKKCCKHAIICEQLQGEWVHTIDPPKKLVTQNTMAGAMILGFGMACIAYLTLGAVYYLTT